MTREEAVEALTRLNIINFRSRSGKTYLTEALTMAINALRTEPCEDIKDALHIAQTDRDKWKARAKKLAKIIGVKDCDIDLMDDDGKDINVITKVGRWIDKPASGAYIKMQSWCSVCGQRSGIGGIESNRHKPYCPNCGVKMEEGE